MKVKKFSKKLSLNKSTVTHLDESRMKDVKGGYEVKLTLEYCTLSCSCTCTYTLDGCW